MIYKMIQSIQHFTTISAILFLLSIQTQQQNSVTAIKFINNEYHDIIIDIRNTVPSNKCTNIIKNLEESLTSASNHLSTALDGRAYFGSIIINLPDSWPDECVTVLNQTVGVSTGEKSDIQITNINQLFGDRMWTLQSDGCGEQGEQIFISYNQLEQSQTNIVGKEFVKEWAKYRYGIFDEIGFDDDKIYPKCHFLNDKQYVTGCLYGKIKDYAGICQNVNTNATKLVDKHTTSSLMFVPQLENVIHFCNKTTHNPYAPTKHNLMCNRESTLDIILKHDDFNNNLNNNNNNINIYNIKLSSIDNNDNNDNEDDDYQSDISSNKLPIFQYRRRLLTRFVIIIDESQEILIRESWNFLRNAIRKWVVYDLQSNTEIGIIMANGTQVSKILNITKINEQNQRDLIASFVPYTPSDSRQSACLSCALDGAFNMIKIQRQLYGNASDKILIIAPGMDYKTDIKNLTQISNDMNINLITINYPGIQTRKPLDKLAILTNGDYYTIEEHKYNSEKSYLNTYFELTQILYTISNKYYEGSIDNLPIEIHRKELIDKIHINNSIQNFKRASRIINGNFYLSKNLKTISSSDGFFIYTHSTETPLIQNIKLISPNNIIYNIRSDLRMPVKQLTLLANINETGSWTYQIDRFNGNPQPHIVQVFVSPINYNNNNNNNNYHNQNHNQYISVIRSRAWIKKPKHFGGPYIIFCEVKNGDYPVHSAFVEVTIQRTDLICNMTDCNIKLKLFDNGSGDPDITKGDGIYTRYYHIEEIGSYRFNFMINDNGLTAYSLQQDNSAILNVKCCGSSITTKLTRQITPFERYLPSYTIHIEYENLFNENDNNNNKNNDNNNNNNKIYGRIGDLNSNYLNDGKIQLQWTSPDLGGYEALRYEIKYSFNINDIIENYETATNMWNHDTPIPRSIGDETDFIIDTNKEKNLFGKEVFFAIRPYTKLSFDAIPGPISNPVRIFIPNKILKTFNNYDNNNNNNQFYNNKNQSFVFNNKNDNTNINNDDNNNDSSYFSEDIDIKIKYAIPIICGTIFVILVIAIYCIFCGYCKNKIKSNKNTKDKKKNLKILSKNIENNSNILGGDGTIHTTTIIDGGGIQSISQSSLSNNIQSKIISNSFDNIPISISDDNDQIFDQNDICIPTNTISSSSQLHKQQLNLINDNSMQINQSYLYQQQQQNQPDHHTIGIPIYNFNDDDNIININSKTKQQQHNILNDKYIIIDENTKQNSSAAGIGGHHYQSDLLSNNGIYTNFNGSGGIITSNNFNEISNDGIHTTSGGGGGVGGGVGVSIISTLSSANNTLNNRCNNKKQTINSYFDSYQTTQQTSSTIPPNNNNWNTSSISSSSSLLLLNNQNQNQLLQNTINNSSNNNNINSSTCIDSDEHINQQHLNYLQQNSNNYEHNSLGTPPPVPPLPYNLTNSSIQDSSRIPEKLTTNYKLDFSNTNQQQQSQQLNDQYGTYNTSTKMNYESQYNNGQHQQQQQQDKRRRNVTMV